MNPTAPDAPQEPDPQQGLITPEQLEILRQKELKNIVDNVAAGKVRSKREAEIIEAATAKAARPKPGALHVRLSDEMAVILGMPSRTYRDQVTKDKLPGMDETGTFPIAANVQAYVELLKAEARGNPAALAKIKARKEEAEARKAELETQALEKSLLPASDVESVWLDALVEYRTIIEQAEYLEPKQKTRLLKDLATIALAKWTDEEQSEEA